MGFSCCTVTVVQSVAVEPPRVRCGFVVLFVVSNDQIAELEDEVTRSAIADRQQVSRSQPVKHRNANPEERNFEALGRLAAMGVRDKEIASPVFRHVLK